jgi:hypothetical protein
MTTYQINYTISNWIPKEAPTVAMGITMAAISHVAIQFLMSSAHNLPTFVKNFIGYSCSAAAIAGTVMAVYAAVRLCQKIVSQENGFYKGVIATTLGSLSTALAQTIGTHFWEIAPSFNCLSKYSIVHCIGTNLVWQICAITGITGIVFTAYAAYRTGQALLATITPSTNP